MYLLYMHHRRKRRIIAACNYACFATPCYATRRVEAVTGCVYLPLSPVPARCALVLRAAISANGEQGYLLQAVGVGLRRVFPVAGVVLYSWGDLQAPYITPCL